MCIAHTSRNEVIQQVDNNGLQQEQQQQHFLSIFVALKDFDEIILYEYNLLAMPQHLYIHIHFTLTPVSSFSPMWTAPNEPLPISCPSFQCPVLTGARRGVATSPAARPDGDPRPKPANKEVGFFVFLCAVPTRTFSLAGVFAAGEEAAALDLVDLFRSSSSAESAGGC